MSTICVGCGAPIEGVKVMIPDGAVTYHHHRDGRPGSTDSPFAVSGAHCFACSLPVLLGRGGGYMNPDPLTRHLLGMGMVIDPRRLR